MFYSTILVLIALVSSSWNLPFREERYKVVIVGAGVSGFTAAVTLLEHNVTDLVILEASGRIGGRIHTVEFGGIPIEKGAEFVHGEKDNAVFELVSLYKLLTSYKPLMQADKYIFANTTGHVFNSTFVKRLVDQGYALMYGEDLQHFNGSMADYLSPRLNNMLTASNVDLQLREAIRHLVPLLEGTYSAADDLSQLGAWDCSQYEENEGDLSLKWKTRGYKTIFDFLSKKFPNHEEELPVTNKTVFNKQVTRVEQRAGDVEVSCADGSTFLADHVIMTVSLGVLKKHAATMFQPPLPADKTAAIQSLGFGCLGKVFLLFPTRWWPTDVNVIVPLFSKQELQHFQNTSVHGYWTSYTTGFQPVMNHDRMLCAWFSGQACRTMDTLPEDQVADGLMELLHRIVGRKFEIPRPESILRSGWANYPFTLGAYSFRSIVSGRRNITHADLAPPVLDSKQKPVILFAGEATALHHWGTVHGALSSGRREALNLIDYLEKHRGSDAR